MPSLYSDAQWSWIVDRWAEGYTTGDLAEFAGVTVVSIRYHVKQKHAVMLGIHQRLRLAPLIPLAKRKTEFNNLGERYE